MPGSSEAPRSVAVSFCTGTDQPVPPTAVAAMESSLKTCVRSGSSRVVEVTVESKARVALSIPNGALHWEHIRDSGGLLVWHAGHSTIKIKQPYPRLCIIHGNPHGQQPANLKVLE